MLTYAYYALLLALLYIYLGLGFTLLCCPAGLRRYTLLLAPVVGYSYVVLAGWYCYLLDLPGTDRYAPGLLIPPGIALCLGFAWAHAGSLRVLNKEVVAAAAVSVIGLAAVGVPLMASGQGLTSVAYTNHDPAEYAAVARYLKEFRRSSDAGFIGQSDQFSFARHGVRSFRASADETVFGAFLAVAIPSSLFALQTYQLQSLSVYVFYFFGALVLYVLAREVFRYGPWAAAWLTGLYVMSPIEFYTMYQGFLAQMIGMSLMLGLFVVQVHWLRQTPTPSDTASYLALATVLNLGTVLSYPHMLPPVYAILAAFVAVLAVQRRSVSPVVCWLVFSGVGLLVCALLVPSRTQGVLSYFRFAGQVTAGWFVPLLWPDTVLGLSLTELHGAPYSVLVRAALTALAAAAVALGLWSSYRNDREVFGLAATTLFAIAGGYVTLAVAGREEVRFGGYKSYKLLTFFLPLLLAGGLMLFRHAAFELARRTRWLVIGVMGFVLVLTGHSCYQMVRWMIGHQRVVTSEMADLQKIESTQEIRSINLRGADWWLLMWEANFLLQKRLYLETKTYYPALALQGDWDLKRQDLPRLLGFDEQGKRISVNRSFVLTRVGATGLVDAHLEDGWYAPEPTLRWTGRDSQVATIMLESALEGMPVDVVIRYWPLDARNRLSIELNGSPVTVCRDLSRCEAMGISLRRGRNVLAFRAHLPPVEPGNGDPRRLSYAFTCLEIRHSAGQEWVSGEPCK